MIITIFANLSEIFPNTYHTDEGRTTDLHASYRLAGETKPILIALILPLLLTDEPPEGGHHPKLFGRG